MAGTINPEADVAYPQKCRSGSTRSAAKRGPALPRPRHSTRRPASGPQLGPMLADAIRLMGRTVRGIASAGGWRRHDILAGRLHAAYSLEELIRDAHAANAPIEDVLPSAWALERFIRQLYGEAQALTLADAFRAEQEAQGRTDLAQHDALVAGGPRELAVVAEALHLQRVATDRALIVAEQRLSVVR